MTIRELNTSDEVTLDDMLIDDLDLEDEIASIRAGVSTQKGGPGSGNRGHAGRPGQRGGSAPREGGMSSEAAARNLELLHRVYPAEPTSAPHVPYPPKTEAHVTLHALLPDAKIVGDVTNEQKAEYELEFKRVLHNMPDSMVAQLAKNLKGVTWAESEDQVRDVLVDRNPMAMFISRVLGFHDSRYGDVVFDGGGGGKGGEWRTAEVFAHELGHAVDIVPDITATEGVSGKFSNTFAWEKAWRSEIAKPAAPLTGYAKSNHVEGFAEFVRLVTFDRKTAEQKFPRSWDFFKRNKLV